MLDDECYCNYQKKNIDDDFVMKVVAIKIEYRINIIRDK